MKDMNLICADAEMELTKHAYRRAHERMGIGKKGVGKVATAAFYCGVKACDVDGRLLKYLSELAEKQEADHEAVVYNRFVFIFACKTMITVLPLPKELYSKAASAQRKKCCVAA